MCVLKCNIKSEGFWSLIKTTSMTLPQMNFSFLGNTVNHFCSPLMLFQSLWPISGLEIDLFFSTHLCKMCDESKITKSKHEFLPILCGKSRQWLLQHADAGFWDPLQWACGFLKQKAFYVLFLLPVLNLQTYRGSLGWGFL